MEEDKNLDNNEYLQDDPIESPTNDCLERSYFAYHLAKSIHNLKTINNSYTIGILGKWGSGKTSTIKMALKYLKELYNNSNARQDDLDKIIKNIFFILILYIIFFFFISSIHIRIVIKSKLC